MWTRLKCRLLGHDIWKDVFTGNTVRLDNYLTGDNEVVPIYRKILCNECQRCGIKVEHA